MLLHFMQEYYLTYLFYMTIWKVRKTSEFSRNYLVYYDTIPLLKNEWYNWLLYGLPKKALLLLILRLSLRLHWR